MADTPTGWRKLLRDLAVEFVESGAAEEVLRVAETGLRSLRPVITSSTDGPKPDPEVEGDDDETGGDTGDELTPEQRSEAWRAAIIGTPPLTRAAVECAFLNRGESVESARRISATLTKEFPGVVR